MTIYEWAKENNRLGDEITVWDTDIDMEFYAYPDDEETDDLFDQCCQRLWKYIEVVEASEDGLTVDLCSLITPVQKQLKDAQLFRRSKVGDIVLTFPDIVSGYVGAGWMEKFTDIVTGKEVK